MPVHYTVFSMPNCPDCKNAKDLLTREGHSFTVRGEGEGETPFTPEELIALVGPVRTLPQIILTNDHGTYHVGGYRDLVKLNAGSGVTVRKIG